MTTTFARPLPPGYTRAVPPTTPGRLAARATTLNTRPITVTFSGALRSTGQPMRHELPIDTTGLPLADTAAHHRAFVTTTGHDPITGDKITEITHRVHPRRMVAIQTYGRECSD